MAKIYTSLLTIVGLLSVLTGFLLLKDKEPVALGGTYNKPTAVFGTLSKTVVTGKNFNGLASANGTSSYATFIGGDTDTAVYTIKIKNASTTPSSYFTWNILGSNDDGCFTSGSSTINWFDVDPTNARRQATITNTGMATGTIVTLTDLNWQCLMFEGNGSSTEVWVQLTTKQE